MNRTKAAVRRIALPSVSLAVLVAVGLLAAACGGSSSNSSSTAKTVSSSAASGSTSDVGRLQVVDLSGPAHGPNGEAPTSADQVKLTSAEVTKLKQANHTAALLWAGSGDWYNAVSAGAKARFDELGIKVTAETSAEFDPGKQANDVESAMAKRPDVILTLPVDPVAGASAFRPAVKKKTVIVFADNGINGYTAGKDYESIVTSSHYEMGEAAAQMMGDAIGGKGKIGVVEFDADYYVTNQRDDAFYTTIKNDYPDIQIVSVKGFTKENATGTLASAMLTQHPDLDGIFVSWDVAAEPVLDAIRSAGNDHVKVVTFDLGATNDVDMAQGGNFYGTVADLPYDIGYAMATAAGRALLGKSNPPYMTVGLVKVTKDNLVNAWKESLHRDPPAAVKKALG